VPGTTIGRNQSPPEIGPMLETLKADLRFMTLP
jgi:hypothetical protein